MKSEKWYFWDRDGRIGISWISKLEQHKDKFICEFEGTLEEAIKLAEDLERTGYEITDLTRDPASKGSPEAIPPAEREVEVPGIAPEMPKEQENAVKANREPTDIFENYEVEGQMSLFDFLK